MNRYTLLKSLTMNPCSMTTEARTLAMENWCCPGCCAPRPGVEGIDVSLQGVPTDKPLNFVYGFGVPLIHKGFLGKLPVDAVHCDLYLGRVFGPDGQEAADWVTFHAKSHVIVRGSEHVAYRKCEICGRDVYFALGSRYLYPMPVGNAILRGAGMGLLLPEEVFATLDIGRWRKLGVVKLPVSRVAKDGLGELCNAW